MAQSTAYDWILKRIREKNVRNYQLLQADKKTVIAEDMSGDLTPEGVVAELEEILPNLSGTIYIKLSPSSADDKKNAGNLRGNQIIEVRLGESGSPQRSIHGMQTPGMISVEQMDRILAERDKAHEAEIKRLNHEHKTDRKLDELGRKLEESTKINPYFEKILPSINGILASHFGKPGVAIAGVPGSPATKEEVQNLIETSIDRLLAIDPEFPVVLSKFADMAEKEPEKYQMAKQLIQ